MHRPVTQRSVASVAAGLFLLTLVVCGIALRLTVVQRNAARAALLDLERQAAEAAAPRLREHLLRIEGEILDRIVEASGDPLALQRIPAESPLVRAPFVVYADGTAAVCPRGRLAEGSPLATREVEPADFESASRLLWRPGGSAEDAIQAFSSLRASESLAPLWRLRALATLAALEARSGDREAALERYREIFEEFEVELASSSQPSYLQVSLAAAACRLSAGRADEALRGLSDALERVERRALPCRIAEERFFLRRACEEIDAAASRGLALPPWAAALRSRLERRLEELADEAVSAKLVQALRDWLLAQGRLEGGGPEPEGPRHFFAESAAAPAGADFSEERGALAVWRRAPSASGAPSLAAVGFRASAPGIASVLEAHLSSSGPDSRFVVRASAGGLPGDFVPLAALPGELSSLQVGLPAAAWQRLAGKAERPFQLAAFLIAALAALLALGVAFLWRGVQREMALARMKTEFVANVSHELKTPLSLIRLFGETLLLERVSRPEQRSRYYQIIARESERLGHLIANVLSFAGIEAGKKTYELLPCDLGEAVRETYDSYRFHLEEKGFEHRLEIEPDLPRVRADPDAVAQALINLLENAVKYSPREKTVRVSVRSGDGAVRISVEDRGVGISPRDQARVWEEYYRTREARALATRGSGLGLSLVRHIVRAHGGRVELESSPGQGSTFTLVFPAMGAEGGEDHPR